MKKCFMRILRAETDCDCTGLDWTGLVINYNQLLCSDLAGLAGPGPSNNLIITRTTDPVVTIVYKALLCDKSEISELLYLIQDSVHKQVDDGRNPHRECDLYSFQVGGAGVVDQPVMFTVPTLIKMKHHSTQLSSAQVHSTDFPAKTSRASIC